MFPEYVEFSLRQLWWERWWRAVYGRIPHLNRKVRELATLFYRDKKKAEISWAHKKGSCFVQNKWFASWDVISCFSLLIWCFFIDLTGHFRFAGRVLSVTAWCFFPGDNMTWYETRNLGQSLLKVGLEPWLLWCFWRTIWQADPSEGLVVESSAQMALFLHVFFPKVNKNKCTMNDTDSVTVLIVFFQFRLVFSRSDASTAPQPRSSNFAIAFFGWR